MYFLFKKFIFIAQICCVIFILLQTAKSNDLRNLQNHRNGLLNLKDLADHWIGYPKSPYTSFNLNVSPTATTPTTPTSSPLVVTKPTKKTKRNKKKKYQKPSAKRRRSDFDDYDDSDDYRESAQRSREKLSFQDFEYDYDGPLDPSYAKNFAPSPLVMRAAASTPKTMMVSSPSVSTSSKALKAIFAQPKVATYVVPNAKKYVVQRVKSEMVYAPNILSSPNPRMYASASNSGGMRRLDPLDYEDGAGGGAGATSFLNLGPQDSFPPRPVLNKIAQPGQRQPCHGPECHQHHKGLVRFYWRRVVYPRNARGQAVRGRVRGRRPRRGRNRRVRPRNRSRAPSDQRDVYITDDDEDAEESEDETNNAFDDNEDNEEEEEEDDEDNEENDTSRRNTWQPGKAYGHDLNEGTNYDDQERKVYRDKRYTYKNSRKQRRGSF